MPIYPYRCENCNTTVDDLRKISERDLSMACERCGATTWRLPTGANLISGAGDKKAEAVESPRPETGTHVHSDSGKISIHDCHFSGGNVGVSLPKGANASLKGNKFTNVKTPVEFRDN